MLQSLFTMELRSFLALLGLFVHTFAFELDLTVEVAAGKMECFFQQVKTPGSVEVEYQV